MTDLSSADTDVSEEASEDRPPHGPLRTVIEWVAVIGGALAVALVIQAFLVQAFYIPSGSMEPTLNVGDRVLVNKLSYDLHDVNRGDLVVFERPDGAQGDIKDLIKRVIALPGETVEIRGGTVLVDGRVLEEPYLADGEVLADFAAVDVPEGTVFVMGDNRDDSNDSRKFGPIDQDNIVGRAFFRVWPLTELGTL
ncbi:MAG: signal peptidase I [Actinomycetota bacterium]